MKTSIVPSDGPVASFIQQHASKVTGVLQGFDRVRVQATLRTLYHQAVMEYYLLSQKLLFKDFKGLVTRTTDAVRTAAAQLAERCGRRVIYLQSQCYHKEDLAREELRRQRVKEGLITVISAVEPCRTWFVRGNRETKHLELKLNWGKCIHLYFYFLHRQLGFLHLRLQTWFPFLVQICFNGREWLSRQMDAAGIKYERRDNCFPRIEDLPRAQQLMDRQVQRNWQELFEPLLDLCHPQHRKICQPIGASYYWTVAESEYATDVMFRSRAELARIYPALVHHSVRSFGSEQVLRFMQRTNGKEVKTDRRKGPDGVRVKHWLNDNSLKLYDKGSVLRSEVTINNPKDFRVWRASELHPDGGKSWRVLRRTVADVPRRAEISRAATHRHLGALSVVAIQTPLAEPARQICRAKRKRGRGYRGLQPFGKDSALLQVVNRMEYTIAGFHNRDLRQALYPCARSKELQRKQAAAISRSLALLRAHGLVAKVAGRHLYHVTPKGRWIITALLTAANASMEELTKIAA
jgi:hypothetical protein